MPTSDIETLIEEIRASIGAIKHITRSDILSVPFETLERIETIGSDLYIEAGRLKKLRGTELEKLFIAGGIKR